MAKKILFNQEAREALKRGVDKVADAVRITIGPRGRNVVLDKGYGAPTITNDGVTIAKDITLKDKFENMGAEIVKEVASKTNDTAGDGTTTSVVLFQAMIEDGIKNISSTTSVMALKLGIEKATAEIIERLKFLSKPVKTDEEIRQVATISAEDNKIGQIIADTIKKIGKDGVVTVEESQVFGVDSEIVEGLEFDKGYLSPYLITNTERMEAEYRDTAILVTDKKISTVKDVLPLLEKLAASGKKDLVIIAEDVDSEALTTFIVNKLRGSFNVLAVKAPGYGDKKKDMLADIAVTVGAKVISEEVGITFEKADLSMLGKASRIISTKDSTVIVGGKGGKAEIKARVESLKKQRANTKSKFDIEKLDERIGKLSGGVAVIKVGAATETEMKYLKLKIEDAVNATKAAISEGIVMGGGIALLRAAQYVKENIGQEIAHGKHFSFDEFRRGYSIVLDACEKPLRQIITNSGAGSESLAIESIKNMKEPNAGLNAVVMELEKDMIAKGIVDPFKVTRCALENAASAVAILLTTEVAIADEPEEKKEQSHGAPGMDY